MAVHPVRGRNTHDMPTFCDVVMKTSCRPLPNIPQQQKMKTISFVIAIEIELRHTLSNNQTPMSRMGSSGRGYRQNGYRHSDHASYFTETSSVTNPPELLSVVEDEDYDDDAISYVTETSALTGWTTENSAAPSAPPSRHQRHMKLEAITESVSGEESRRSQASSYGDGVSAYNDFESAGASFATSNFSSNKAAASAGRCLSPRSSVTSPRSSRLHNKPTFRSDDSSLLSNASKKRDPVPQLRNPDMDDAEEDQMWEEECNSDINPTPLYQIIISRDWKHVVDLLDGKEEDPVWSLPGLTGIHQLMPTLGVSKQNDAEMRECQRKLRVQARTWIVHRQRGTGILKWRMLPIHVALSYQAPFEVMLRLYNLYPGSVRCRDHRGMLPLHICFFRGGEDRVLELFLDVFPDALDVKDDKGRTAIECTPEDGSENERRSNIMKLFLKFMMEKQELIRLQEKVKFMHNPLAATEEVSSVGISTLGISTLGASTHGMSTLESSSTLGTTVQGSAPQFTSNEAEDDEAKPEEKVNKLMLNAFKLKKSKSTKQESSKLEVQTKIEPEDEDEIPDKYSLADSSENSSMMTNSRLGLTPIEENGLDENIEVLQSEFLALGKKKTKKGIRKMFGKKNVPYN